MMHGPINLRCYLMLSKEFVLRVYEYRVLRETFEPRREEVTGEWGKLPREGLQDVYTLPYTYY